MPVVVPAAGVHELVPAGVDSKLHQLGALEPPPDWSVEVIVDVVFVSVLVVPVALWSQPEPP